MALTLEEFVSKYNGKPIDYDKAFGPQCVDLFRQACPDLYGIKEHTGPCTTSGGAKDLFLDYDKMPVEKKYFTRIKTKSPKAGDTVIWDKTDKNEYGHVAICLGVLGKDTIIVFEQDGFKKDGAKVNIRSKGNMLGVLRKK